MKKIFLALSAMLILTSLQAQKQKVIFDCDLGGDIDDAFAVALLLCSQDEFEILGICMDHGNTPGRGSVAVKMLYETGNDHIPVYLGRHTPTVVGLHNKLEGDSPQFLWAEGFDKLLPQDKSAVDFIIESLNKYPDEIILFTVGPVDNIGDVIDKDPGALKKAKRVVSMFGSIEKGYDGNDPSREWNVVGSPAASKKFINSGANITLAPLDVTYQTNFEKEYLTAVFNRDTPLTDALGALYSLWFLHAKWAVIPKMHDGVAIGMVLWPDLFKTKEAYVYVDDKGFTRIDESKDPNCTIGMDIDADIFLDKMYRRIVMQEFRR
jgi:inosine-uridine nucleoside N-ribohydrolase